MAFAGQQSVGTHHHAASGNIFGNHRICPHRGSSTDDNPAENLCPRADIHTVFYSRGTTFKVTPAQRHLMADNDVVANLSMIVDDNAQRVWQKNIFRQCNGDVAAQKIHIATAYQWDPVAGTENQQPGKPAIANPGIFRMVMHGLIS